jgi:S-formylglutathione hydrolase FrmB
MRRVLVVLAAAAAALVFALQAAATAPRGAHVQAFKVDGLQEIAVVPAAVAPTGQRPMVLFLYGRGGHASDQLSNQAFFDALRDAGKRAPVFVFAQSNDHSYWHDRAERKWGAYLWRHVIPAAVKRFGIDSNRIAVGGISMGGFGAFDIALHHPGRFCAVGGHSPAIFTSASETAPGAFDDAADFARNDVVALARRRRPARRVWIDSGDADPFLAGDRALGAALGMRVRMSPGGHDAAYWHAHYRDYLRFYASALARC